MHLLTENMNRENLLSSQCKITYLGTQEKPIPTIVFAPVGYDVVMDNFLSVQKNARHYTNDELPYVISFMVSSSELERMLSAVDPILTEAVPQFSSLSFAIVSLEGGRIQGHEYFIGSDDAHTFYRTLLKAIDITNQIGRAALQRQFHAVLPGYSSDSTDK